MKPFLRIIGDVHGNYHQYINLARKAEYSIQVGDLGFEYTCLNALDSAKHKVLAGNHDNYHKMNTPHWLGDYGNYNIPGFGNIFFVRGGRSIDRMYRVQNESWWEEEELSYGKMQEALQCYIDTKPDRVISHECPLSIIEPLFGIGFFNGERILPSMTAKLLDVMWSNHSPKEWIFGHHHKNITCVLGNTIFRCLAQLEVYDFNLEKQKYA